METNKSRCCEERLVCLAQTWANVEFMGCRYPQKTMDEVKELEFGVPGLYDFREGRKGLLKRTFVSGADAAEAKVQRKKGKFSN